jgi:hypothetical protein
MLVYPLLFFIWKIFVLPWFVWWFVYGSESRNVMWVLGFIDLIYF